MARLLEDFRVALQPFHEVAPVFEVDHSEVGLGAQSVLGKELFEKASEGFFVAAHHSFGALLAKHKANAWLYVLLVPLKVVLANQLAQSDHLVLRLARHRALPMVAEALHDTVQLVLNEWLFPSFLGRQQLNLGEKSLL